MKFWLLPISRLQVKDDEVGKIRSMLVFTPEDQDLVTAPKSSSVPHPYSRNVAIVVDEVPLPGLKVETQHVVVNLISVLIEATKCVDLIVTNIGNRGTDKTCWPLTNGTDYAWLIAVVFAQLRFARRGRHEIGVIG